MTGHWYPDGTQWERVSRPIPGRLIAYHHAVWRVDAIRLPDLDGDAQQAWLDAGMPDLDTWPGRPYDVDVTWIGGHRPDALQPDHTKGAIHIPARRHQYIPWQHYPPSGRWPQCSCCGEPMPCRAELADRVVDAAAARVERYDAHLPGTCWACGDPVTSRQRRVTYPGDNVDHPTGPAPTFHTRRSCRPAAGRYEERWLAADPRRERILTYPACDGILYVHADGTSECQPGRGPLGAFDAQPQPDCRGHLTHDHALKSACYVAGDWLAPAADYNEPGRCPRGCSPTGHPGTRTTGRPERRDQEATP